MGFGCETIIGRILRVTSAAWIAVPERVDENGKRYGVGVEDSAATLVEIEGGAFGSILSSWATRVRRDDLFTLQVDGTMGSAVAGLHRCHIQAAAQTPVIAHFSVMKDMGTDYRNGWVEAPPLNTYCNPYRVGWEQFLRHVGMDAPLPADFSAGVRDVAFAEACHHSMLERAWIAMPEPASAGVS
jgi:predicted dehydrogenase